MAHEVWPARAGPPSEVSTPSRRDVLLGMGAALLSSTLWAGPHADAAPSGAPILGEVDSEAAFAAGSLSDVLNALGGQPTTGPEVSLNVPDFVENGAIVPVEVTTHLAGAQTIFIVSESNPYPLVASFLIPEGTLPVVAARIKVAESCNVHALVRAGGRLYGASKSTKVSIGGCGD